MKSRVLILSLGLVAALQSAVIFRLALLRNKTASLPPGSSAVAARDPGPSAPHQNPASSPERSLAEPFNWRQIESPDYSAYVRNLRSIHCPEQTIHDIILADVDFNLYAAKREKIWQQEQPLAADPLNAPKLGALRSQEKNLWMEEAGLISKILGREDAADNHPTADAAITSSAPTLVSQPAPSNLPEAATTFPTVGQAITAASPLQQSPFADSQGTNSGSTMEPGFLPGSRPGSALTMHGQGSTANSSSSAAANVASSTTAASADPPPPAAPTLPLAFATPANGAPPLSPTQAAAVTRLQQNFVDNLQGLDPASQDYAKAWQTYQPNSDAALRAVLGGYGYEKYQLGALIQQMQSGNTQP